MTSTSLPPESLRFLDDLAKHNDKRWFEANRNRCERDLLAPARALVERFCEEIGAVFPQITGSTNTAGGSLTRLHRDVRFSTDKRPFHTHIGMRFWHRQGPKAEVPGFFLRVDPAQLLMGTGLHQPGPVVLDRIRRAIDRDQKGWERAVRDQAFRRAWGGLEGESLKRVPAPFAADHPCADDLKRKDFTAFIRLPAEAVTKAGFVKGAVKNWETSKPLMFFLCRAMNLDD
jgi:uncharacterized protein (TIGR02453 family)